MEALDAFTAQHGKIIPGFGHRFHPTDPRSPRLLSLVDAARDKGVIAGRFADIGRAVESELQRRKGRKIPMNIDGATAVIYAELGFSAPLGRGLFILSRSVGILAHAWEQAATRRAHQRADAAEHLIHLHRTFGTGALRSCRTRG